MQIEVVSIDSIKEYEFNAKEHPKEQIEQIKKSIQDFGNNDPIAVDNNGEIIEGHGRFIALKELGYTEVEIIRLGHLTEEQRKAYRLIHNKLTMNSDFDFTLLEKELAELSALNIAMSDFGFDESLFEELNSKEIQEDDFDIDAELEEIIEPVTKLGYIWKLGNHKLMCGDSTNAEDVERLMGGEKADMVFTDPPYNVNYQGGSKKRETIQNDFITNFYTFLYEVYVNAFNVMKSGSPIYVAHSELERVNFTKAFIDAGFKLSSVLIWAKNNSTFSMNKDYKQKHEPILYGWKQGKNHAWIGGNCEDTLWEIKRPVKSELHPTMKPIELCARAIRNSSTKFNVVYEPFGGSGSTLMACEQLERTCYTMELDPKYCDVIIKRWEELTGEKAELLNGRELCEL